MIGRITLADVNRVRRNISTQTTAVIGALTPSANARNRRAGTAGQTREKPLGKQATVTHLPMGCGARARRTFRRPTLTPQITNSPTDHPDREARDISTPVRLRPVKTRGCKNRRQGRRLAILGGIIV